MALTKYNFNSFDVTPAASNAFAFDADADGLATASSGAMNLITTNTISSGVSSSSFTSSIDSTYDTYLFKFINIHPSAGTNATFQVGFRDGSTAFDAPKASTNFETYHAENDDNAFQYLGDDDQANATGYQILGLQSGSSADDSLSGSLHLFSPSSTTFVKHFMVRVCGVHVAVQKDQYCAGYLNVTAAIDGVDFKFSSGNIDSGVIKMYGISKS